MDACSHGAMCTGMPGVVIVLGAVCAGAVALAVGIVRMDRAARRKESVGRAGVMVCERDHRGGPRWRPITEEEIEMLTAPTPRGPESYNLDDIDEDGRRIR